MDTKSKQQFKFIFENDKNIKLRLLKKLAEHDLIDGTKNTIEDWDNIISNHLTNFDNDEIIYLKLRELFKKENKFEDINRSKVLAKNIIQFIPKHLKINSLLDYGCSSGAITKQLGELLKINNKNLYGSDIKDYNIENFNFILLNNSNLMPQIPNKSIDLITCSMVLHHIENIDETILEFKRILSKNGIIIIREHDCQTENFAVFLDIIHGLYSLVWSDPMEDENFIETYFANYKKRKEWIDLFNGYGFYKTFEFIKPNSINAYYSVFKLK
jgi:ubiquinone/menaquinone biosynthesis C-methylase UbiE